MFSLCNFILGIVIITILLCHYFVEVNAPMSNYGKPTSFCLIIIHMSLRFNKEFLKPKNFGHMRSVKSLHGVRATFCSLRD